MDEIHNSEMGFECNDRSESNPIYHIGFYLVKTEQSKLVRNGVLGGGPNLLLLMYCCLLHVGEAGGNAL